jgi:hypothetical protein
MGSTIFFIVGGCTGLEDSAPTIFSVVLSWLGGFFCSGFFCGGFTVFSDMLWWLGGFFMCFCGWAVFFAVLRCFFCFSWRLLCRHWFFLLFGGDSGLMSISWLELVPTELNNDSCVDGE